MKIERFQQTYFVANFHAGEAWLGLKIRFGKLPENISPTISIVFPNGKSDTHINFDLAKIIDEVIEGTKRASQKFNGNLEVVEIQVRANDRPERRLAEHVAYKIASFALQDQGN